jgi:hypothetical protein
MYLIHKLDLGRVDLHLRRMGHLVADLQERLGPLLGPGMSLVRATESAAVRIDTPVVNHAAEFGPQKQLVLPGIEAADRLLRWARQHSAALKMALDDSGRWH